MIRSTVRRPAVRRIVGRYAADRPKLHGRVAEIHRKGATDRYLVSVVLWSPRFGVVVHELGPFTGRDAADTIARHLAGVDRPAISAA